MCARFTVLSDTPIASAIAGCLIPLSRSNTIWMRWRSSGFPFQRSAVFNRRTWPLVHLTICSLRIRWSKNHTSRRRENPGHARHPAPHQFRFNQLWKWYHKGGRRKNPLLLIATQRVGELVVIFGHEIDIALVLDRGDRRLQRVIELGKCFLLVAGRHFLVGLNLRTLRRDDAVNTTILLARRIEAREHHAALA